MNHIYRLKRNGRTHQVQPVPESARLAGKGQGVTAAVASGSVVGGMLSSVALAVMTACVHAQQAPPAANQLPTE